jgi:hypothetical protein
LEPELPDRRLDLGAGLRDDRAQFVRGRRYGNGAGTLGDRAVVRRGDDGRDLAIEPADDGRRRPRRGAVPSQPKRTKSTPCSRRVGTRGAASRRSGLETPSIASAPSFANGVIEIIGAT